MPSRTPRGGERLEDIHTRWSLLRLAHHESASQSVAARDALVLHYAAAIRGYVGAMLPDASDADELAQDVVMKLLKGGFASANPERGRFRDLLKVAARNQVRTFLTRRQKRSGKNHDLDQFAGSEPADVAWDESWRNTVLSHTWAALEEYERSHRGSVAHTVLKLRVDHPDDDSPQLADRLAAKTRKPFNAASMRQQLHRARLRFAQLLLEEVSRSLDQPSPLRVREELADLGLLAYVEEFLPADFETSGELTS